MIIMNKANPGFDSRPYKVKEYMHHFPPKPKGLSHRALTK